jgi:hypothetical protein
MMLALFLATFVLVYGLLRVPLWAWALFAIAAALGSA